MKNVLIIDPGYSLKNAMNDWKKGNFPGSVLYGVNHIEEYGYRPIFEELDTSVKEVSQGHKNVILSRVKSEFHHWREIRRKLPDADIVYMPLINFGLSAIILKRLKRIKVPLVGIVHSINYRGINYWVYQSIFSTLDFIVFLSEKTREEAERKYKRRFVKKSCCIELMPEEESIPLQRKYDDEYKYDVCMIGKTNRDYETFSNAVQQLKCKALLVGGQDCDRYKSEYIDTYSKFLGYDACKKYYGDSRINCVITQEAKGIFGLTSIVDSFQNEIPIIATKTEELAVEIQNDGLGLEVVPYSSQDLCEAIEYLLNNRGYYDDCVRNLRERKKLKNTKVFAQKMCMIFDRMIEKEKALS